MKSLKKFLYAVLLVTFTLLSEHLYSELIDKKNIKINDLKHKVAYIDKQLNDLYIPLKQQIEVSEIIWNNYQELYASHSIPNNIVPGKESLHFLKWQRYMLIEFLPIHIQLYTIVSKKRSLALESEQLSTDLNNLVKHISQYRIIFKQWNENSYEEKYAHTPFPKGLLDLIKKDISKLEQEKLLLLNKLRDL